ncbi:alpha/beta hydrolase fold domain-containing protein [Rhizobium bangladeshense]|uniref:alpha/beta hydrolase fold domain-containing protein n=1 Tax=Rhizobium bangladeshense TaxID=1138189 RepID=UPI000A6EF225|nr:alpha/beta hydrolase fold domain-containing protein [Rhizobium bangladeshense]
MDYSEVTVAGSRALWIVPEGSRADQVLFYVHGGGFVGGSIYSHRKLVGHLASAAGTKACWSRTQCRKQRSFQPNSST